MTHVEIPAFIPLSLLEAIRNLDKPAEDGLEEMASEHVTKRLGLSSTVAAQIERYRTSNEREGTVEADEALSVFRLVGRRPDSALVFADAGRRAARYAARTAPTQTLIKVAPGPMARRMARRSAARVARDAFAAEMLGASGAVEVRVREPLSVSAWPDGAACGFYGAAFTELLRTLTGFEGMMRHESCRARGDAACVWQAAGAMESYE